MAESDLSPAEQVSMIQPGPGGVPDNDLYESDVVAVLRLPIRLRDLLAMSDSLTTLYGPGLTMTAPGPFLVIRKPEEA
jgi:hypothetical protein